MVKLLKIEDTDKNAITHCQHQNVCSGCQSLGLPYETQAQSKINQLIKLFTDFNISYDKGIEFSSAGPAHLRDRLDFSGNEGSLGLYEKTTKNLVDIVNCSQLTPSLQEWLSEYRKLPRPFKKGSVRLRVGPQGQKGLWLDLANIDVKGLLEEKNYLQELQKIAVVEVGQRRKVPFWNGREYKLRDPELHPWFQTWVNETPVSLYCHVASFTQPSLRANKLICDLVTEWTSHFPQARLIEFGSGIGNLTLPAAAGAKSLLACEIDELSLEGLQKTLENLPPEISSLKNKIEIHRGDFQKKILQDFSQFDGIIANPPRSGLMNFLNPLGELQVHQRPEFFIYMSCYPESLVSDLSRLQDFGYATQKVVIVDQFPQTKHYEVLVLLQRK